MRDRTCIRRVAIFSLIVLLSVLGPGTVPAQVNLDFSGPIKEPPREIAAKFDLLRQRMGKDWLLSRCGETSQPANGIRCAVMHSCGITFVSAVDALISEIDNFHVVRADPRSVACEREQFLSNTEMLMETLSDISQPRAHEILHETDRFPVESAACDQTKFRTFSEGSGVMTLVRADARLPDAGHIVGLMFCWKPKRS